jgi:hypothetical protein
MKRTITCPCGKVLSVEAEDPVDLDQKPEYIEQIASGSFMTFPCSSCGKNNKPEFPARILWPSRRLTLEVLPELERGEFYRRKQDPPDTETIISYPELADRIAVIRDGLEPAVIEMIKYMLLLKAEESYPDCDASAWYMGKGIEAIEFHLHGLKTDAVAVIRTPLSLYDKTLSSYQKKADSETFAALRTRSYLSVQNALHPGGLR